MNYLEVVELVVHVFTIGSIIYAIRAFYWGVENYNKQMDSQIRQMNAQIFVAYTKRFEEIMQSFPRSAWAARLKSQEALPEPSDELSTSALKYLNLCSEEYYLWRGGYLSKQIWKIWEDELKRTLQTPLFIREWKKLSAEFEAYPEFRSYVETTQRQAS